jgi:UDP-4-amino-4,6-dideoxy-N-acetyl-beta-L-altrosamine transaminase
MLPYGRQCIEEDDISAVAEVLRSDFLTTGPKVEEFEKALCAATGARYAVACSNGTTALHLAALALELGEGDAVIVPSTTFLATANAVRYTGADVIFADVDPDTGLMGVSHLEEAISRVSGKNLKAVFPVHLAGQCADLLALRLVADKAGIKIVTDCCHAIGGSYRKSPVGACTDEDMATFSFHPVKTIAMGEGGAITTNRSDWAEKMRRLRSHGMIRRPEMGSWFYEMPELGYNYRASDIQCALGASQMKKLERFVSRRREIVDLYDRALADLAPVVLPPARADNCNPAWHLYAVRIDFEILGISRSEAMAQLMEKGIGTQVHYIPVHAQPYYRQRYGDFSLPGAESYYKRTLSLPLYPSMSDENVLYVAEELKRVVGGKS